LLERAKFSIVTSKPYPRTTVQPVVEARPVVGLMLPTAASTDDRSVDPARAIESALRAEAAGFDGAYVGDHILHPWPLLESVVTLSVVAASTRRISIGPCVMLIALRQPLVLAKQLGTLATFAPGRLRIGVGVGGEYPAEFEAAGVPLADRGRLMEAALLELRSHLTGGGDDPVVSIEPRAGEVPFLLAGWRERSLRRAATFGDGWIGYLLAPDSFARRRSFLLECRAQLGRVEEAFTTGILLPVHIGPDAGRARSHAAACWARLTGRASSFPAKLFLGGTPEEIVRQLGTYWDRGCTEMILAPADQGAGYFDQLAILADEVLPAVREFS
jgi:alkanesulfonate monooxygenase SsuD/methylene tetrahydromethanopterin reductase-like flavin-dependent oxidoreductase (luciferase family)